MNGSFYQKTAHIAWHAAIFFLVMTALYIGLGRFAASNVSNYSDEILKLLNVRLPFSLSARQISGIWR